jgi:hypothetical protein
MKKLPYEEPDSFFTFRFYDDAISWPKKAKQKSVNQTSPRFVPGQV